MRLDSRPLRQDWSAALPGPDRSAAPRAPGLVLPAPVLTGPVLRVALRPGPPELRAPARLAAPEPYRVGRGFQSPVGRSERPAADLAGAADSAGAAGAAGRLPAYRLRRRPNARSSGTPLATWRG
ncbi:MAG: hypothetical protein HY329_11135 [Chloroflexi bacterium]|nr:hypothetical protein [Chloroflexota bacterium]